MPIKRDRRRAKPEEAERDPVLRSPICSPVEDDLVTPAEDEAIAESYRDIRLGRVEALLACGGADVEVTLAGSGDPGAPGDPVVYTATVANLGPERAIDTLVDLPLSAAVRPRSATPSQGSCAIAG